MIDDEAGFALPGSGCTVILSGAAGNILCQVECPDLEPDRTWALQSDGTYIESDLPSPGYENTEDGCLAYRASQTVTSPLIISEVMPSNCSYLMQADGEYYD